MQQLRVAARGIRKHPKVAIVTALSLALGVGPNLLAFSFLNAVLFRSASAAILEGLLRVSVRDEKGWHSFSYPDFQALREAAPHPVQLFAWDKKGAALVVDGLLDRVPLCVVTGDYFSALGLRSSAGRLLSVQDDVPSAPHKAVVISHSLWLRRFAGDRNIIGKQILVNTRPFVIVGVAPKDFRGLDWAVPMDLWAPVSSLDGSMRAAYLRKDFRTFQVMAHVVDRPRESLQRELAAAWRNIAADSAGGAAKSTELLLGDERRGVRARNLLFAAVILGGFGLVLLVACANVAGILLAHWDSRRREMAIRLSLGASRSSLVFQLLVEALLLAAAAVSGGIVSTWLSLQAFRAASLPLPFTFDYDVRIDGLVLVFTVFLAFATTLLFGLLPALQAVKVDLNQDLREGRCGGGMFGRRWPLRRLLVAAQIAFCQVLFVAASYVFTMFVAAQTASLGVDPERNLILIGVIAETTAGRTAAVSYPRLAESLRQIATVQEVSYASSLPLGFSGNLQLPVTLPESGSGGPGSDLTVSCNVVGPKYFRLLGTPLLSGREFGPEDQPPRTKTVIINDALARRFWPEAPRLAVGKTIVAGGVALEVIGVVLTGKYASRTETPQPFMFFPFAQSSESAGTLILTTRSASDPRLVSSLVQSVERSGQRVQVTNVTTWKQYLQMSASPYTAAATVVMAICCVGMLLAGVGLYGVISYEVARRKKEIGIRIAVGATPRKIGRTFLLHGVHLAVLGVLLGSGLAAALAAVVKRAFPGFPVGGVWVSLSVAALLIVLSVLSVLGPALAASRLEPNQILRAE